MNREKYIARCLALAQKGSGHTAPNPMVGALLVYNDVVIGEGWHHVYGGDHAEVDCLNSVEDAERELIPESTMYVSLEPCAHFGNTPPCASRIVADGIKKVIICNKDPFVKVSGRGIEILKKAGVQVSTGVLEKHGLWLNRRFFCFHTQHRPYIILKWAQTSDGFIAPGDRSRLQITGAYSQMLVHKWRAEEAAIMVGTTTAINDNPQLTARLFKGKQPLRIAIDQTLQIPTTHHLYDQNANTWIVNEVKDATEGNIRFIKVVFDDSFLNRLMGYLHEARILSIVIEGGAALLNSFIEQGLWDEARVFTSKNRLGAGIQAPQLTEHITAFTTFVETDTLSISVNKKSPYSYVQGLDL